MTMDVFEQYLLKLNQHFAKQNRKIILLVDNAGGHNLSEEFKKLLTHGVLKNKSLNTNPI